MQLGNLLANYLIRSIHFVCLTVHNSWAGDRRAIAGQAFGRTGGKSGHCRAGWLRKAAWGDPETVPQKTDRPPKLDRAQAGKGETVG